ncbi:PREDICTED: uncharacterized protein LOC109131262 [Camelina sativa]|uniref:Uncharacterized protein LOC109131262 n=1 Tax=Camelina sativa TaxID=90675 RepID=A0ABM1RES2_CAMSA|nr:PREDICTED: uncharacterized protein LOC109131262 [Camelina sativa]
MLVQPGREKYTSVLSPSLERGTTWFGKDKSSLTRQITKVFTNKFDGPFYSWGCVPNARREGYFLEFAKTHTWDPSLTGVVQAKFYSICQNRMKDMVSKAAAQREEVKPRWIERTLWKEMCDYWDTEEAMLLSVLCMESTYINDKGTYFGVGSLGSYINEKRKYPGSSSTFTTLQQQLEDANRKIEEQAALQAERDAEASRVAAEALRMHLHWIMIQTD